MTSTHPPRAGIDAMAFHGPEHYVDMAALARARGVDPAKYLQGLGQRQMAVPTPCEDTVSMAAAGRRALTAFDVDPAEIGMLIAGTEAGVDHSKPVAVYVHDLLGLPERCRTFETKHDSAMASPDPRQLEGDFFYVGTRDHVRRYRGAPAWRSSWRYAKPAEC